jgi:perosamine synthetase
VPYRTADMTTPKQIIYPLRYARSLLYRDCASEHLFEKQFAVLLTGNVFVIPIGRARGGIYILVKLAVTAKKRRIIMSPYTIPDVVNMARFAGAEPVFVDVLPNSTNVDMEHLSQLIDDRTACVLITHYHVTQNQTIEIRDICRQRGAALYDDCALAIGADIDGSHIGGVTDASVFSLSGFKALNFFWGGAITTASKELAQRLSAAITEWPRLRASQYAGQLLKTLKYDLATRQHLFARVVFPVLRSRINSGEIEDILPLSRIESTVLDETITSRPSFSATAEWSRKISSVPAFLSHRRNIASIYDGYFRENSVSPETSVQVRSGSCFVNYPIFVETAKRNGIYKGILARGFDVGLSLYPNTHETPGFEQIDGRSGNVSALVRSVITLPTHPRTSAAYAQRLAIAVKSVLKEHGADRSAHERPAVNGRANFGSAH